MNLVMDDVQLLACLRRAQAGDGEALDELLRHFRPRIYRYCLARLGQRDEAQDVTQETCLALATALPSYQDRGRPVAAFVFGIASNKIRMSRRSSRRHREDVHHEVPDRASAEPSPGLLAQQDDELARLLDRLGTLPDRQREILLMRVVAGLSAAEVADILGMTPGSVRVAQHRALTELRQTIPASLRSRRRS